jgi:hypothetical protein
MRTALDIIRSLGGYRAVAAKLGVPYTTVHTWAHRNRIPAWRWQQILAFAADEGVSVNAADRPDAPIERVAA